MKALTVQQPWAWAIMHGGKRLSDPSSRTGSCPASEYLDTHSARPRAYADGLLQLRPNVNDARITPSISPALVPIMVSSAETVSRIGRRAKCHGLSRRSVSSVRQPGHARGPRRILTNGSGTAESLGSSRNTASLQRSTTPSWRVKAVTVRSAGNLRATLAGTRCTWTTTTRRGRFEAFSAVPAIEASAISATISSGCAQRSGTSNSTSVGGAS
jgi:hypothetical protein